MRPALLVLLSLAGACTVGDNLPGERSLQQLPDATEIAYATHVVEAPGATGDGFLNEVNAVNGVRGEGDENGSTDVFSLGYTEGQNNYLVLSWNEARVLDGPGADFKVFENPFRHDAGTFMDQVVVDLSIDGSDWIRFPHDYLAVDETKYVSDPSLWVGFGGTNTFAYHEEESDFSPFDSWAGGDALDLASLPNSALGNAIREQGFRYIRLTTAPTVQNPDTNAPFVHHRFSNGADIAGVYGRYVETNRDVTQ